jgi:hypothetical protein
LFVSIPSSLKYSLMQHIWSDNTLKYYLVARLRNTKSVNYRLQSFYELVRLKTAHGMNYALRSAFKRVWKPGASKELSHPTSDQGGPNFTIGRKPSKQSKEKKS